MEPTVKCLAYITTISLLAFSQHAAVAQEKPKAVTIAGQNLTLPVPDNYVKSDEIPVFHANAEAATPPAGRLLLALYPKENADALRRGKPIDNGRYFLISTERESEALSLSISDFAQIRDYLKKRTATELNKSNEDTRKAAQAHIDANFAKLLKQFSLQPMTIRMGDTVKLGLIDEQENYLSTASTTRLSVIGGGKATEKYSISVSTLALVKGKMIIILGYSKYRGEEDFLWLKRESKAVVNHIHSANR
jgi:hypothetical protein